MTSLKELKDIIDQHISKFPEPTEVYIALSIEDIGKILDTLKKSKPEDKGVSINIKIDPHHMSDTILFIYPDLGKETYMW